MQVQQGQVIAQEADLLHEAFELTAAKTGLKELLMGSRNGLASLEVGAIHANEIRILREGGSVGSSIPPVLASLHLVKEVLQGLHISASLIACVHHAPCSLSVLVG